MTDKGPDESSKAGTGLFRSCTMPFLARYSSPRLERLLSILQDQRTTDGTCVCSSKSALTSLRCFPPTIPRNTTTEWRAVTTETELPGLNLQLCVSWYPSRQRAFEMGHSIKMSTTNRSWRTTSGAFPTVHRMPLECLRVRA